MPLRIVSTTLTRRNGGIIGEALRSVADIVDHCLVIDTELATDAPLQVASTTEAMARTAAGVKLRVHRWPWRDDFGVARNAALAFAQTHGADWAITVDSDERLEMRGDDLRATIEAADARGCTVLMMFHASGSYSKPRAIKVNGMGEWRGRTHEAFIGGILETFPNARFQELAKTDAQLAEKFARDEHMLRQMIGDDPTDARWHYYLGDTLANLGRPAEAIAAFLECEKRSTWDEEQAWSLYRAAVLEHDAKAPLSRIFDLCLSGMRRHPGIAELPWFLGWAHFQAGQDQRAIYWASMAKGIGNVEGCGETRRGFRYLPALYEAPFDVERHALRRLGRVGLANGADKAFHEALLLRIRDGS